MLFVNKRLTTEAWLAYIAAYKFTGTLPSKVVLHHTYIPDETTWRGLATMNGMRTFYEGKGWSAGPHIYVAPDGIWLATPLNEEGIHANSGNGGMRNGKFWYSIGVEMVGFFDKKRPSGVVLEQTQAVLGGLLLRLGLTVADIDFHRDFNKTKSCPGWMVDKPWVTAAVTNWQAARAPIQNGLTPAAAPRISSARFASVLEQYKSPAAPLASELYGICVEEGIDPGVALAFFVHESSAGTAGLTKTYDLKNWGNVRSPEDANLGTAIPIPGRGNFAKYISWQNGLRDWCKRIKGPKYAGSGLVTVEQITPKYAPSSDANNPAQYAVAVREMVAKWAAADAAAQPQPKPTTRWRCIQKAGSWLRQSPRLAGKQVRGIAYGEVVEVGAVKTDGDAESYKGDNRWLWLADGSGFTWAGNFVKES